ncbi:MAG: hypothetical protein A7315_15005 [Candidatus Altiarchaeales archaeon WOR_SM1_79]|nr:MAG: hypothetical protein A7315_15005 [Candidatus Altiarchaeales archaeon WOR_SM1_79]
MRSQQFLIFLLILKVNLKDVLLGFGNLKPGLKYSVLIFAVALPVMAYGSTLSDFSQYYPIWKPASDSTWNFILYESAIAIRMLATEFFYRGFLMWTLMEKMDERYANLIHSFVYMLMHIGKPPLEVPYSFIGGYVFAWVDLRSKSILPSFLIHFLGSLVFDLMIINQVFICL